MSLRIRVNIDRKAALLAGKTLQEWEIIEIEPSQFPPEIWAGVVDKINMSTEPATLQLYNLPDNTPSAIIGALQAEQEEKKEEAARDQHRIAEWITESESIIRAGPQPSPVLGDWDGDGLVLGSAIVVCEVDGLTLPRLPAIYPYASSVIDEIKERYAAIERQCIAHNKSILERELPRLLAERNEQRRIEEEQRRQRDAERAAANAIKFKIRLETGYWERETDSYNERRYSAPWCARVAFPNGPKPVYEFGDSTGKWGKAGLLRVPCKPGDIIAYGQKDLRRPGNSEHTLLVMRDDGSMEEIDKTEAFRRSQQR